MQEKKLEILVHVRIQAADKSAALTKGKENFNFAMVSRWRELDIMITI